MLISASSGYRSKTGTSKSFPECARKPSILLDLSETVNHEYGSAVRYQPWIDENQPVVRFIVEAAHFIASSCAFGLPRS